LEKWLGAVNQQFFGGYWGSKLAHKENIKKWVYGILIFIIIFEIITLTTKLF
jgi:hypothetical protein